MTKSRLFTLLICFLIASNELCIAKRIPTDPPVQKGDYKILKIDALNLMGFGVQKLHLGYEISPMKGSLNALPTVNFNLNIPFNSLNELDINYGIEGGADLRFYQKRRLSDIAVAEGFYIGVGIDGGVVSFSKLDTYNYVIGGAFRESLNDYTRVRTGIFVQTGAQSKLGEKLYFDINLGMGWSNVNVREINPDYNPDYIKRTERSRLSYLLYEEGKAQRFYMPISLNLGYNFGSR